MADSQRVELAAMRTQVEAMKVSVTDYERAVRATEERLTRERAEAEAADKPVERSARQARRTCGAHWRTRAAAAGADDRSGSFEPPRGRAGKPAREQGRLLAEREFEITRLRSELEAAGKIEHDLREELENAGGRSSGVVDKFRADIGQLEAQLAAAVEERTKLQREIATMKRDAETTWAAERVENALLRERINDVAAEVARLTAVLEGPGSPIETMLAEAVPELRRGAARRCDRQRRRPTGADARCTPEKTRARLPTASAPCSRAPPARLVIKGGIAENHHIPSAMRRADCRRRRRLTASLDTLLAVP